MCSIWQTTARLSRTSSAEQHAIRKTVSLREITPAQLLAVGAACPQNLDCAALCCHQKGRPGDVTHLADLAGDVGKASEHVFARIEDLNLLSIQCRPCTRCRIAAAYDVVNEIDVRGPVDTSFGLAAPTFVTRKAFVLLSLRVLVGSYELRCFQNRFNAERKELVEVDIAESLIGANVTL